MNDPMVWFYGWSWLLNWGGGGRNDEWWWKPLETMVWIRGRHLRRSRTYYAPKIMAFFSGLQRSLNLEPCWTPKSVLDEHKSWKKGPMRKSDPYTRIQTAEPSKKRRVLLKICHFQFLCKKFGRVSRKEHAPIKQRKRCFVLSTQYSTETMLPLPFYLYHWGICPLWGWLINYVHSGPRSFYQPTKILCVVAKKRCVESFHQPATLRRV